MIMGGWGDETVSAGRGSAVSDRERAGTAQEKPEGPKPATKKPRRVLLFADAASREFQFVRMLCFGRRNARKCSSRFACNPAGPERRWACQPNEP